MISSVVIRLRSPDFLAKVLDVLESRPEIDTGQPSLDGCSLPITIEASDAAQMEQRKRWIEDLPGVEFVDVVCVYLDV